MKFPPLLSILSVVLLMAWTPLPAQTTDDSDTETPPPPGATVITSDELHSDQQNHISIFTGKVVTVGTNFRMTCQEMTVYFTNDNKVNKIVATGDVIITQPDRITPVSYTHLVFCFSWSATNRAWAVGSSRAARFPPSMRR